MLGIDFGMLKENTTDLADHRLINSIRKDDFPLGMFSEHGRRTHKQQILTHIQ